MSPDDTRIACVAAAICNARVDANPDGCGGGKIGYHAIGEPGRCKECIAEAKAALSSTEDIDTTGLWFRQAARSGLERFTLYRTPQGRWQANAQRRGSDGWTTATCDGIEEAVAGALRGDNRCEAGCEGGGGVVERWIEARKRATRLLVGAASTDSGADNP